jgi:hypothetical protein
LHPGRWIDGGLTIQPADLRAGCLVTAVAAGRYYRLSHRCGGNWISLERASP